MITVKELIEFLKSQPEDLLVVYSLFSEQCLLLADQISITELCYPRPDGWVPNPRPDKPTQNYLLSPGN